MVNGQEFPTDESLKDSLHSGPASSFTFTIHHNSPFTIYHLPLFIHIFLTKHLPGSARTNSRISSANSAAVRSEIESFVVSSSASMCAGLSADKSLKTACSAPERLSGTNAN